MVDDLYEDQLIEEKPKRLSEEVRAYNKMKNHFSKSTAEDSEIGVRDLEHLLGVKELRKSKDNKANNRSSTMIDNFSMNCSSHNGF